MPGRLTASAAIALLLCASHLQADWIMLDTFDGQGPIGGDEWYQTTPVANFYMGSGRLLNTGKAMAIHQDFPAPGGPRRVRFEAYSGTPGVGERNTSVQAVSAIVGAKSESDYFEVKLLSDNLVSTDFFRLQFYSVLGGAATNNLTVNFAERLDAVRLDAHFVGNTVNVEIQPFDRAAGTSIGAPLSFSFGSVPAALADDPDARRVGLAAQGQFVEIDDFEGFIIPEATTFMTAAALSGLALLRPRRRKRVRQ
jgi:hypothetical protein